MLTNHRLSVDEYLSVHTEICYCESLIFPDGTICDCIPSHEIALARASPFTFNALRELIPISASPVDGDPDGDEQVVDDFERKILDIGITTILIPKTT